MLPKKPKKAQHNVVLSICHAYGIEEIREDTASYHEFNPRRGGMLVGCLLSRISFFGVLKMKMYYIGSHVSRLKRGRVYEISGL